MRNHFIRVAVSEEFVFRDFFGLTDVVGKELLDELQGGSPREAFQRLQFRSPGAEADDAVGHVERLLLPEEFVLVLSGIGVENVERFVFLGFQFGEARGVFFADFRTGEFDFCRDFLNLGVCLGKDAEGFFCGVAGDTDDDVLFGSFHDD